MYQTGTRVEVKLRIKSGDETFEPGLKGTIAGSMEKMVGKSYRMNFDDGRTAEMHIATVNNHVYVITPDGEKIDPKSLWKK